jgi:hypothetical protein
MRVWILRVTFSATRIGGNSSASSSRDIVTPYGSTTTLRE